jgi:hypothetical protein
LLSLKALRNVIFSTSKNKDYDPKDPSNPHHRHAFKEQNPATSEATAAPATKYHWWYRLTQNSGPTVTDARGTGVPGMALQRAAHAAHAAQAAHAAHAAHAAQAAQAAQAAHAAHAAQAAHAAHAAQAAQAAQG